MLEVGWHRSAQLDGDEWWCAAGSSAARRPAPHLHATFSPSWIISGLAVLELLFHNLLLIPGTPGKVAEMYISVQRWSLVLGRKADPGQSDHPDCEQL